MDIKTIGSYSYDDISVFSKCCHERMEREYSLQHSPKPLLLKNDLTRIIEMILWYIPCIDSIQSYKHELIEERTFDDFTFALLLDMMEMSKEDVLFLEPSEEVPDEIWSYYQDRICVNCQKFVIVMQRNQTKTLNVLRCIRNSVAHGEFNIWDDCFIGFNTFKGRKKAVVKFRPGLMLNALDYLNTVYTKEYLYEYIFTKAGYEFEPGVLRKNGKEYDVEIKTSTKGNYMTQKAFEGLYRRMSYRSPGIEKKILIIDNIKLKKDHKKQLDEIGVFVIDYTRVKEMLNGRDVLSEL